MRVRYLLPSGAPLEKTYTVTPKSRFNIWVDFEEFPDGSGNLALANTDVSAVLEVHQRRANHRRAGDVPQPAGPVLRRRPRERWRARHPR